MAVIAILSLMISEIFNLVLATNSSMLVTNTRIVEIDQYNNAVIAIYHPTFENVYFLCW